MSIIIKWNGLEVLVLTWRENNDTRKEISSSSSKYRGVICDLNISGGVCSKPMSLTRRRTTLSIMKQA